MAQVRSAGHAAALQAVSDAKQRCSISAMNDLANRLEAHEYQPIRRTRIANLEYAQRRLAEIESREAQPEARTASLRDHAEKLRTRIKHAEKTIEVLTEDLNRRVNGKEPAATMSDKQLQKEIYQCRNERDDLSCQLAEIEQHLSSMSINDPVVVDGPAATPEIPGVNFSPEVIRDREEKELLGRISDLDKEIARLRAKVRSQRRSADPEVLAFAEINDGCIRNAVAQRRAAYGRLAAWIRKNGMPKSSPAPFFNSIVEQFIDDFGGMVSIVKEMKAEGFIDATGRETHGPGPDPVAFNRRQLEDRIRDVGEQMHAAQRSMLGMSVESDLYRRLEKRLNNLRSNRLKMQAELILMSSDQFAGIEQFFSEPPRHAGESTLDKLNMLNMLARELIPSGMKSSAILILLDSDNRDHSGSVVQQAAAGISKVACRLIGELARRLNHKATVATAVDSVVALGPNGTSHTMLFDVHPEIPSDHGCVSPGQPAAAHDPDSPHSVGERL